MMNGMSFASLKKHPALIPLWGCIVVGCSGALFYTWRLASRSPEVMWTRSSNPEPWNEWANKRYQFYSPSNRDKVESPAPKY